MPNPILPLFVPVEVHVDQGWYSGQSSDCMLVTLPSSRRLNPRGLGLSSPNISKSPGLRDSLRPALMQTSI
jgi:hypothetical protein